MKKAAYLLFSLILVSSAFASDLHCKFYNRELSGALAIHHDINQNKVIYSFNKPVAFQKTLNYELTYSDVLSNGTEYFTAVENGTIEGERTQMIEIMLYKDPSTTTLYGVLRAGSEINGRLNTFKTYQMQCFP